uniref:POU class 2 homeobox 2a n=1 Tax=Lepisosteus oculatus TaxID=7918 RepID=W5MAY0_LEPOC
DIRMSKPAEAEKSGVDSSQLESTDSEKNGPDSNHQVQPMKVSPFALSPTLSSNKVSGEHSPHPHSYTQPPPDPQNPHPHHHPPQLTLSQPIQLTAQDIQQLLQLQQLVLVPGHHLQSPAQFLLPQAQQGQQGLLSTPNLIPLPQQNQGGLLSGPPRMGLQAQAVSRTDSGLSKCMDSVVTSHPEEPSDLEELEQFARTFKQRRIKLGFTQVQSSLSLTLKTSLSISAETMSMDSTLPSPSALSSPPLFEGLPGRRRKKRTSIETNVRVALERSFIANQKPTSEEILLIAEQLHMEKEVIRVWFCNRRQKEKRINPASATPPLPSQPPTPHKPTCYSPHMKVMFRGLCPGLCFKTASLCLPVIPSVLSNGLSLSSRVPVCPLRPRVRLCVRLHASRNPVLGVTTGMGQSLISSNHLATIQALAASGGQLPISSLDGSGKLVLGASGGAGGGLPSSLFLNHGGLPLLASGASVGLVSAAVAKVAKAASLPASTPSLVAMSPASSSSLSGSASS